VLDGNFKEVPENVVGILYIGGDGISYGYLNDSGKTANGFIPDPFSPRPGMRLYKTGDLVRRLPSGNIEYIGRVDNQIKIRGFRVEINEIENAVNKLPQITETAVVVNVSKEKERLVCFYVSDNEISYNEFVRKLKGLLPDYMIPSAFVKIEKLPITINGKIDRKNLAEREFTRSSDTRIIVDPNTEKEKILFDIWRKVLKTEKFGITDNFFELGGDSIIGIQIISEARQNGLLIKPIHLFQYQTIKDLAVAAEDTDKIFAEQGLVVGDSDLTPIQKSFFEMNFHNPNHWNQSLLLKVDDILDIDILKSTVLRLLEHHDALRIKAAYDKKLNEYRQIFSDEINQNVFEYYEINGLDDQRTKIEEICSAVQSSLDLERGEIIKIAYIRINNKEGRLLFVIHHIAVDGVSWRILIEDFQTIYTQLLRKSDIIIPAKTTSFKDWSKNLKTYLNSEKIDEELEYWLNISKDINKHLPVDYNNGLNDERSSKNIEIELSAEETEHLTKDVHSKYNTKINDILLTALIRSYAGWTGKRSLTINMENHGRDLPIDGVDVSRTVGWFTSIYPCHLDLRKTVDPGDAIKNIKEQLRLIPNNGNKYGLLRFLLNDMDRVNQLKVFDDIGVTFNYLGQTDNLSKVESLFSIAAENKGNERDENNLRESLIDITGIISGGKMRLSFSFSNNIFNESTITEWAKLYIKELKDLIIHCLSVTERSFTSSDFNLSNLNDKKLEKVLNKVKKKK
jgi:non-ribosomal peptide synthase protein (TIGR01720 family)